MYYIDEPLLPWYIDGEEVSTMSNSEWEQVLIELQELKQGLVRMELDIVQLGHDHVRVEQSQLKTERMADAQSNAIAELREAVQTVGEDAALLERVLPSLSEVLGSIKESQQKLVSRMDRLTRDFSLLAQTVALSRTPSGSPEAAVSLDAR